MTPAQREVFLIIDEYSDRQGDDVARVAPSGTRSGKEVDHVQWLGNL